MPRLSTGAIFGDLTQDQKEEVLAEVGKEAALLFKEYVKAAKEGVGLRSLTGQKLLQHYQQRTPEVWEYLSTHFPQEYERQIKEWERLETRMLKNPPKTLPSLEERLTNAV